MLIVTGVGYKIATTVHGIQLQDCFGRPRPAIGDRLSRAFEKHWQHSSAQLADPDRHPLPEQRLKIERRVSVRKYVVLDQSRPFHLGSGAAPCLSLFLSHII